LLDMIELCVEREVELEADIDEVWAAIVDVDTWLVDAGELDLESGSERELVDGGVRRRAVVDEVVEGRRLAYRWWSDGDAAGDMASRVDITLEPRDGATRVVVRETPLPVVGARASVRADASAGTAARVRSGRWWEVRLTCLAFTALVGRVAV
jgi:uncharacterized protein YndB with AHSA1/START domain